jgi:tetratricopeptide (TPR) repeat protein
MKSRARASKADSGTPALAAERARLGSWELALIFGLAWGVRLVVARELESTALFRSPQLDAFEILSWAQRIVAGDWRLPIYPTHGFPFPFLLAFWLKLSQGSIVGARACQAALGALNVALAARLALSLWRRRSAAWTAGLLVAFYGPLVLVDISLWEETLLLFALLLFLSALAAAKGATRWASLGAGLALGLAVAVRPTAIALLPVGLYLVYRSAVESRARRSRALAFVLGVALVVAPAVALASRAAGTFLFVRGFGAINLWIGNDPAGGGIQNARLGGVWDRLEAEPVRAGIEESGRLEGFYLHKALARAASDPAGLVRAVASKALWLFQAEEPRDNHSYFFFREQSRLLALLPGFGLLLVLAAVGLSVARSQRASFRLVLLYLIAVALPVLAALMGMRYRLPMVLGWMLLAALAPAALDGAHDRVRLARLALLTIAVFGFAHLRRHEPTHHFGEEWGLTGNSWIKLGDLARADEAFRRADAEDPSSGIGPDGLGRLRQREGKLAEAEVLLRDAIRRDPNSITHHVHLAEVLVESGRVEEGLGQFRAALEVNPLFQPVLERIAEIEMSRGRPGEALVAWTRLAHFRRTDARSWLEVARLDGATGRTADGVAAARRATVLAPDDAGAWRMLGFLAVEAGQIDVAREALGALRRHEGSASDPQDPLLAAAIAHSEGRWEDADRLLRELLGRMPTLAPARALLLRNAARAGRVGEAEAFLHQLNTSPR